MTYNMVVRIKTLLVVVRALKSLGRVTKFSYTVQN